MKALFFKCLVIFLLIQVSDPAIAKPKRNYMPFAPKSAKHSIIKKSSGVPLRDKVKYKVRHHKCKLYQSGCHVKGNDSFNWGRRPKGNWPFEFLQ